GAERGAARRPAGRTGRAAEVNRGLAYAGSFSLLCVLIVVAFAVGRFQVGIGDLLGAFGAKLFGLAHPLPENVETVIFKVRGPRVLAALIVGAALAAAGTAYQGMFRNPLVSPDLLGVATGAALGAVLGIFLSRDVWTIQAFAFAGGLAAVALVYWIGSSVPRHDPLLSLVLTGIVIGTLLGAGIALLKYL